MPQRRATTASCVEVDTPGGRREQPTVAGRSGPPRRRAESASERYRALPRVGGGLGGGPTLARRTPTPGPTWGMGDWKTAQISVLPPAARGRSPSEHGSRYGTPPFAAGAALNTMMRIAVLRCRSASAGSGSRGRPALRPRSLESQCRRGRGRPGHRRRRSPRWSHAAAPARVRATSSGSRRPRRASRRMTSS